MTGEFEAIAERSRLMAELLEVIVGNEKKVSKKIRGQMTIYLKFRKEHMGLESRKDEEVWGFLSIIEEKVEEERLRYFSAMVLSQVQINELRELLPLEEDKGNYRVLLDLLHKSSRSLMEAVEGEKAISGWLQTICYRCWGGVSLAQGWLIESFTPSSIYMTYDYVMLIYSREGKELKQISTAASKVSKVEGMVLFLSEKVTGFFKDSVEEYKIKFTDPEKLEEFQLCIENQVK